MKDDPSIVSQSDVIEHAPTKQWDPLIDPTVPFPPRRYASIVIGSGKPKAVILSEAEYQILHRMMEEAKKKAADDHAKQAILNFVARWHRMRDRDHS